MSGVCCIPNLCGSKVVRRQLSGWELCLVLEINFEKSLYLICPSQAQSKNLQFHFIEVFLFGNFHDTLLHFDLPFL